MSAAEDHVDNKLSRQEMIDRIPLDAKRVKVRTAEGHMKYRTVNPQEEDFADLRDSDEILLLRGRPITMNKTPGRKKKSAPPTPPEPTTLANAETQARKIAFMDHDPLLKQIEKGVESEDVLLLVMRGFAMESASLEFERLQAEADGKETSAISMRRINALKAVVDSWLKRKDQLSGKTIDMASPAFTRLFAFMLETFREAMLAGGIQRDQAETVFSQLSSRMSDETWELEAQNKMKGS